MTVPECFARPTGRGGAIAGAGCVGKFRVCASRAAARTRPHHLRHPGLDPGWASIPCAPIVHADHHLGDMLLRVPVRPVLHDPRGQVRSRPHTSCRDIGRQLWWPSHRVVRDPSPHGISPGASLTNFINYFGFGVAAGATLGMEEVFKLAVTGPLIAACSAVFSAVVAGAAIARVAVRVKTASSILSHATL